MSINYKKTDRGNRLNPKRTHSRFWVLTSLRNTLIKIINEYVTDGLNILDFGCGNKPYEVLFADKKLKYIGADLNGNELAEIIIQPDGTLPIDDSTFNFVISSQVLEHVEDPTKYLSEAFRILKQNGILILSTHGFWQYHPDPKDYWRWTSEGLKKIIKTAGFNIEDCYSVMSLPSISLQFWQDSTLNKVPRIFRKLYIYIIQLLMEIIDKKNDGKFSENPAVFVFVAKKNK